MKWKLNRTLNRSETIYTRFSFGLNGGLCSNRWWIERALFYPGASVTETLIVPSKNYLTKSSWSDRFLSLIRICFSTQNSAWFQFCAGWLGCCCFSEICRGFSRKKKLFKKINKSLINFAWPVTIKTCQVIHLKKRPVIYEKNWSHADFWKKTTYTHLHKEKIFSAALIYIKKRKLIDWREILRVSFEQKSKQNLVVFYHHQKTFQQFKKKLDPVQQEIKINVVYIIKSLN